MPLKDVLSSLHSTGSPRAGAYATTVLYTMAYRIIDDDDLVLGL